MVQPILVSESTLTERYQTTIPDTVRKALHLKKKDKICFTIASDGNVLVSRAEVEEDDPVLGKFLAFLANDIAKNPAQMKPIKRYWRFSINILVNNSKIYCPFFSS